VVPIASQESREALVKPSGPPTFMKFLTHIPSWLKNKYVLTAVGFTVWILFFDARDFITSHFRERGELKKLEQSKKYYEQQITTTQHELDQLKSNPALLEKYAREKYLMKRDNEDLFVIRSENPIPANSNASR
jgi:cell division protein DivIC